VFDNSEGLPILIAEKSQRESSLTINNQELFKKLKEQYENRK
jgi:hypothetical protein